MAALGVPIAARNDERVRRPRSCCYPRAMPFLGKVGGGVLVACCFSTLVAAFLGGCSSDTAGEGKLSAAAVHDRSPAKLTRIDSDASHVELTYDATGTHLVRQTFVIEAAGPSSTIDYTYEGDHIVRDVFTGKNSDGSPRVSTNSYEYDGERLVRTTTEYAGETTTTQYDYDVAGALVAIDHGTARDSYSYDESRRLTTIDGASGHFEFSYDAAGHLAKLADGAGDHYEYTYDESGRVEVITSAEGQRHSFAYDEQGRLSVLTMELFGPGRATTLRYTYAEGSLTNMSLRTGIDGNYEVRNFVDLEGHTFSLPDPRQLDPNL